MPHLKNNKQSSVYVSVTSKLISRGITRNSSHDDEIYHAKTNADGRKQTPRGRQLHRYRVTLYWVGNNLSIKNWFEKNI